MFDPQLISMLPTLRDLLGPGWESCTSEEAYEKLILCSEAERWPKELWRQTHESMIAIGEYRRLPDGYATAFTQQQYEWLRSDLQRYLSDRPRTTLSHWLQALEDGVAIQDIGPLRRKILNHLFGIADKPIKAETPTSVIPAFADLLGVHWETCHWQEAMSTIRDWFEANPSAHAGAIKRLLHGVQRHFPECQTLGAARQQLTMPSTKLKNVGNRSWQILYHLFAISSTLDAATGKVHPDFDMSAQAERLEYLSAHLSESDRRAWITLGRRMLPDTEAAPTELTDIHPRLRRDQIMLWLDLGEQMLQRATTGR